MKIGFIGIGQMGRPMSQRLQNAGHELFVHDLNKEAAHPLLEKGAKWMTSPKAVAESCTLVLSSLPGPPEVEGVVYGPNGLMAGWKRGDIYIDLSTNAPATIRKVSEDAKAKGVSVIDAPVLGRKASAEAGTLVITVGGAKETLDKVRGVLEVIGNRIFHMGDVGSGNFAKLINNLIACTCNAINAEGFVLAAKAGIDIDKLWEVVTASPGNNWWLQNVYPPSVFKGNFEGFKLSLACKDMGLALALGKQYNIPMPVGAAVEQKFIEAKAAGFGDKGTPSLILRLEQLAGVEVRSSKKETRT